MQSVTKSILLPACLDPDAHERADKRIQPIKLRKVLFLPQTKDVREGYDLRNTFELQKLTKARDEVTSVRE